MMILIKKFNKYLSGVNCRFILEDSRESGEIGRRAGFRFQWFTP